MGKKNCERKERGGCKSYNPQCGVDVYGIYPHQKKKVVVSGKEKEVHDTG